MPQKDHSHELLKKLSTKKSCKELIRSYAIQIVELDRKRLELLRAREQLLLALRKVERKLLPRNEWQQAYDYATQEAEIADVVRFFLNIEDIEKAIPCPFHDDKRSSFRIYQDSNAFHCFGCKAHGNPINFVTRFKNCGFKEAVWMIAKHI